MLPDKFGQLVELVDRNCAGAGLRRVRHLGQRGHAGFDRVAGCLPTEQAALDHLHVGLAGLDEFSCDRDRLAAAADVDVNPQVFE